MTELLQLHDGLSMEMTILSLLSRRNMVISLWREGFEITIVLL